LSGKSLRGGARRPLFPGLVVLRKAGLGGRHSGQGRVLPFEGEEGGAATGGGYSRKEGSLVRKKKKREEFSGGLEEKEKGC